MNTASWCAKFTTLNECVEGIGGGTFGFQPRIVPPSVANRNTDGPEEPAWWTLKPVPPLNTSPVGASLTPTTSGFAAPVPS